MGPMGNSEILYIVECRVSIGITNMNWESIPHNST